MPSVMIELRDLLNRPVAAEVLIRHSTVEIRLGDRLVGTCDRVVLRDWLAAPFGRYTYDEVTWLSLADGIYLTMMSSTASIALPEYAVKSLRMQLEAQP